MERNLYCELDDKRHSKITIVRTLKKFGKDKKEYFDQHYKTEGDGVCGFCGKETLFTKFAYRKFCNTKCASMLNQNTTKMWANITPDSKKRMTDKMVCTRKSRHTNADMHAKRKDTVELKYGISYEELKSREFKKRYAAMTDFEYKAFFDKVTKSKNCYKYHMYSLNGVLVRTQGYEKYVLDVLKTHFPENTILIDRKIKIYYKDKKGKTRRYYPDIIIDKLLFEVKSKYTLTLHSETTLLKMDAALKEGYAPILVVWDPNNSEMCKKDLIETISSQDFSQEVRFNDYPFIGVGNKQMIAEALGTHKNGL